MQIIEPLLRLLDSLQGYTSSTDLHRMREICADLERRALVAIETPNTDSRPMLKRKRTFEVAADQQPVRDEVVSDWLTSEASGLVSTLEKSPEDTSNHEVPLHDAFVLEAAEPLGWQQHISESAVNNVPSAQDAYGLNVVNAFSIGNTAYDQTQADWAWLGVMNLDQGHEDHLHFRTT